MENEESIDSHYQQGFNEGYLVTKHWPEMSDMIAHVPNATPRLDGFRDGKRQFVLEQAREQRPKWMEENRDKINPHDLPKGKDIDREK